MLGSCSGGGNTVHMEALAPAGPARRPHTHACLPQVTPGLCFRVNTWAIADGTSRCLSSWAQAARDPLWQRVGVWEVNRHPVFLPTALILWVVRHLWEDMTSSPPRHFPYIPWPLDWDKMLEPKQTEIPMTLSCPCNRWEKWGLELVCLFYEIRSLCVI